MLSVIVLFVIMLSVVMLVSHFSIAMLSASKLAVVMLNVVMLSIAAPINDHFNYMFCNYFLHLFQACNYVYNVFPPKIQIKNYNQPPNQTVLVRHLDSPLIFIFLLRHSSCQGKQIITT